jgi:hemoglobin
MRPVLPTVVCLLLAACAHSKATPAGSAADAAKDKPAAASQADPAPAPQPPRSLFERLGGMPAIDTVVSGLMANVAADERINAHFAIADLDLLHKRLNEFLCVATGGPCKYTGRNMADAHRGMGVTSAQFDALAEDLVKTLDANHVPEKEKGEIINAVAPLKKEIVEIE